MHKFCEKKLQICFKQPVKGNLHIFSFSWLKIRLFKILQKFCIFEMAWSRAFQKIFCKHFYFITWFCDEIFFADSKSRAQELSNDISFVIFGHQTWDLEGGANWPPPQHILVFKYPSRDRVKHGQIFLRVKRYNTHKNFQSVQSFRLVLNTNNQTPRQ